MDFLCINPFFRDSKGNKDFQGNVKCKNSHLVSNKNDHRRKCLAGCIFYKYGCFCNSVIIFTLHFHPDSQ